MGGGRSGMSKDGQAAIETLREFVRKRYQDENWRVWSERTNELTDALHALSRRQALQLATELWAVYDHNEISNFLGQINTFNPGALAELSETFLAEDHLLPSWLYLGASSSITRRLLDMFDQPAYSKQHNGLLLALAWIGDEQVRDQFRAWRENPPAWGSQLYIAPHEYA